MKTRNVLGGCCAGCAAFLAAGIGLLFAVIKLMQGPPPPYKSAIVAGGVGAGYGGDGGKANQAPLNSPQALAIDSKDNLYIADCGNGVIRKVDASGIITTFAGTRNGGSEAEGVPALKANLGIFYNIACGPDDSIIFTQQGTGNKEPNRIRKINPDGFVVTIAGAGAAGFSGDGGPALKARLNDPRGVCADAQGNVYFIDLGNDRIRKITPGGIITTVVKNGIKGSPVDGRPLKKVTFTCFSLAVNSKGELYVDAGDRIRKIDKAGIVTTVLGGGEKAEYDFTPNTSPLQLSLSIFGGVAIDKANNLYVISDGAYNVYRLDTQGRVEIVGGDPNSRRSLFPPQRGDSADMTLAMPAGIAVDSKKQVYVSDVMTTLVAKFWLKNKQK